MKLLGVSDELQTSGFQEVQNLLKRIFLVELLAETGH